MIWRKAFGKLLNGLKMKNYCKNEKVIILLIVSFGFLSYSIKGYPGYTVPPKTKKLLFYIQRNHNRNTIVYDAIFDKSGNLDKNPINVY